MYQAIVLANKMVQDRPGIKKFGKCIILNNLIGDCFRILKTGQGNFDIILDYWTGYQNITERIIKAVFISAKAVFKNCSIEMD